MTAGVTRMVRSLGRRCAEDDPPSFRLLMEIQDELAEAMKRAVEGWRAGGFSDGEIGEALGVTKQAVQQRWPRSGDDDA